MLSKEEIEDFKIKTINTIKNNNEIISDTLTSLTEQERLLKANNIMDNALYFIEKLETDKQKLIEKLEKDIIEYRKEMENTHIKLNQIHFMKRIEYAKEILEILKGEME